MIINAATNATELFVNCEKLENDSIVFKAIIPKGAWYYNGKYGERASSKLIITNKRYN